MSSDAAPKLTKAEATAYLHNQDLTSLLQEALNQTVLERAANAPARIAEILKKAGHDRDNTLRMRELFARADSNGNGRVTIDELRDFKLAMGEPLSDDELHGAFKAMGGSESEGVGYDQFAGWYDSARSKGGLLSSRGASAEQRRRSAARASRASKEQLDTTGFDASKLTIRTTGEPNTLEFRVFFELAGEQISPWHDIPLYPPGGAGRGEVNMVVEIPKFSRAKFEIATGEPLNPIKQDTKKGRLREYNYGDMLFNYGCFPQTWEDPSHVTEDTSAHGDNDPIDAMEIGTQIFKSGSVVRVKVLGCLAMIDDGETDWKVVCVNVDDPLAARCDDIDDVERVVPGYIGVMREWLRMYKVIDGKPKNEFGLEERALNKEYTMKVVEETHAFWQQLIDAGKKTV